MNYGAGAASAVGAVVGLFAGSFVGKMLGGKEAELVGGGLAGVAVGAFIGAALVAPDASTTSTTTTTTGTSGLPSGVGVPLPPRFTRPASQGSQVQKHTVHVVPPPPAGGTPHPIPGPILPPTGFTGQSQVGTRPGAPVL